MFIVPGFIDMPELVNHARQNHARWHELDDAGVTTLADVRRAQRHLALPAPTTTNPPTTGTTTTTTTEE